MERKEKILLKLNIKDYTNSLEKILEKKQFSLDAKNLLLSMLYKIENGYNDYAKTKVVVPTKKDFIENLLENIKENCDQIIVAEFNSKSVEVLKQNNVKYIIDKQQKEIIAYGNEALIFNCIIQMTEHEICMPQEKQILTIPISYVLNLGSRMNKLEVIRDFNGWSWDVVLKEITDININLIFQNLLILMGNSFVEKWILNDSKLADYLELLMFYLKDNFGEERAKKFINIFCKLAIDIVISKDEKQYEFWKEKVNTLEEELDKLQNKQKFLSQKTKEKKQYTKQIEEIDKIINNKELLKQEYTNRNAKLPNKEKIFSISHLVNRLLEEREDLLEKIKICNNLIEPKGYVARKQEVEEKIEFLRKIDINKQQDKRENILELCSIFLECFQIKIAKAKTKQEILDYIYELRYYGFLSLDLEGNTLKQLPKLKTEFEKAKKQLLQKAKRLDVIEEITEDEEINEKILNKIFDSKMIDLDHMVIETKVIDGKLYAEYYDEKVLETSIEIESNRTVRLKRKTKLFI